MGTVAQQGGDVSPGPTDPGDPQFWANPDSSCVFGPNLTGIGPSHAWTCLGLPAKPWPWDTTLPQSTWGPPYTTYEFSAVEYGIRLTEGFDAVGQAQLDRGVAANGAPALGGGISRYLYQLRPVEEPAMSVDLWRCSIHASLPGGEESINVLHYRDKQGSTPHTDDVDGALVVGNQVAARWQDFLQDVGRIPTPEPNTGSFPTVMQWDEVRVAKVRLNASTPVDPVPGALSPEGIPERHKIYKPNKPDYLVETQYIPFANLGLARGAGNQSMPYEVACCLSLGTGLRGGRNRGRCYLGPLNPQIVDVTGKFLMGVVRPMAESWKRCLVDRMQTEVFGMELVIASGRFGTCQPVTEVRVGEIPDSQRRRRRSQNENYVTV